MRALGKAAIAGSDRLARARAPVARQDAKSAAARIEVPDYHPLDLARARLGKREGDRED